jgi:hypothetical protein
MVRDVAFAVLCAVIAATATAIALTWWASADAIRRIRPQGELTNGVDHL